MKVLVDCVPILAGGGVQVAIALLANLRAQSEVAWTAVVPSRVMEAFPPALASDSRITAVGRRSQLDRVWLTSRLRRIERKAAPNVVFTVFGPPFFRSRAPQLVGFALPHLIYERDALMPQETFKDRIGDRLRCKLFRRADHLVVETETARVRLARRLGIPLSRVSVVPNSFNPLLERIADIDTRPPATFAVLIPSAYYWHKNLEIVPEVAAQMRRRDPGLDFVFRLTLAPGSPEWLAIADKARKLGVKDRVSTLGVVKITELARAYADASAVYLPTLREVSTAVYPESFFFRRPLVTADMDFARELCGEAAIFVPPRDAAATAERLIELARSAALRAHLVSKGDGQLVAGYPAPAGKLQMQLELLAQVAAGTAGADQGSDNAGKQD
jgi:glycosyltransferase involved in cell wall biosynthesis